MKSIRRLRPNPKKILPIFPLCAAGSFTYAGFLVHEVVGFAVAGVLLLLLEWRFDDGSST